MRELVGRERRGRDDEQRLERARELVDRICGDQAERAIHSRFLSSSVRETLIGPNGAACSSDDLARLAQLEQREEGDRLVDARQRPDLGVEVEAPPSAEQRAEALEELRDGRKPQRHVRERDLRRRLGEQPQRRGEPLRVLRGRAVASACGASARRPDAEVAVALAGEALGEPRGRLLHPAVLGQAPRELLRGLLGLELGELRLLVREERARLQLEQRRDQDEELAAGLEIELVPVGEPLDERDHDRGHVDVGRLELLPQERASAAGRRGPRTRRGPARARALPSREKR